MEAQSRGAPAARQCAPAAIEGLSLLEGVFPPVNERFSISEAETMVRDRFEEAAMKVSDLTLRRYPDEVVFIVRVPEGDLPRAAVIGNALDADLADAGIDGFVTVRSAVTDEPSSTASALKKGVHEARATALVQLISARSRTSEIQPSLSYVRDAAANIAVATAPRHHLVFGRRGAGKTSLMVEAK